MACSSSSELENTGSGCLTWRCRSVLPAASCCSLIPACPRRSETPATGSEAKSANVRTPQSRSVSRSQPQLLSRYSRANNRVARRENLRRQVNSSPAETKVIPFRCVAAWMAASGFAATATLTVVSNPPYCPGFLSSLRHFICKLIGRAEQQLTPIDVDYNRPASDFFHHG